MKENLLHFIWKLKLFSTNKLTTVSGKKLEIISVGLPNFNAGPDFLNAKLVIDGQIWAGNVEIHTLSSFWYTHSHEKDVNYDAVILHVVWEHDLVVYRNTNEPIETLVLKDVIDNKTLENYEMLFNSKKKWINCENELKYISDFTKKKWLERLYFERLEQKSIFINEILDKTSSDWEATLFILLAKNFGLKVNGDTFLQVLTSFDFSILRKLGNQQFEIEALLFGQAGLLQENKEGIYYNLLRKEYQYLSHKFRLTSPSNFILQFFRLRPANFPTIRLSQLAVLFSNHQNLFSKIMATNDLESFYSLFSVQTSSFWETHYTFDTVSKKQQKKITKSFIDLLLINTIIPLKFVYLKSTGNLKYDEIFNLISKIKPEKNKIISNFELVKFTSKNAFHTQGLLQLKNNYCNNKLCLACAIGKEILKR
jgi:hypothetical protein